MNDPMTQGEQTLSLSAERRVDAVCLRFEAVWRSGERPRVEDYLAGAPESDQVALGHELRRLEAELTGSCPARESAPLRVPGYEVRRELGRGGMGIVYEAWHLKLKRADALKCILAGRLASREEVERFTAEARAAAALDHPNIVPIYDVGEHEGQHYFTMKLVSGDSLAEQVARGPLPSRRAAELIAAVAHAMHCAHGRGILHRDLKPANILLDEAGRPLVTDFGLAKRLDGAAGPTQSGSVVGTPAYMSPEQCRAEPLDGRCDVYALGAVLYALLTGRPPFQAETLWDTFVQVQHERPAPPRLLNPKIEPDVETICLKCLEKKPGGRYATAAELAEDLERYLRSEPIRARPPSWLGSLRLQFHREPVEPETWRALSLWAALIVSATHLLIWWLVRTGQPPWTFWACYASNLASLWTIIACCFARRRTGMRQEDRHVIAVWVGHTLAVPVLWLTAGMPCDERLFSVYPAWATLYGLSFFAQGSFYWGRFYLLGLAWFALALLMPLRPEWAPLEYAVMYAAIMLLMHRSLGRMRQ